MSLGLTKTKRRILSVKSTKKITKAMEMVATVKLKKFRDLYDDDLLYSGKMQEVMAELFAHDTKSGTHYGKVNEQAVGTLYIVITSDLGLCAAYNSNIYKYVDSLMTPLDTIAPIGGKGLAHFKHDEKYQRLATRYSNLTLGVDASQIKDVCEIVREQFNHCTYRQIVLIYTKYINSMKFEPAALTLLPVNLPVKELPEDEVNPPIFEPEARKLIHELMPQYLSAIFYSKFVEAQLSEQASRRTAMDTANDNADDLIDKLTIQYNNARQGAITQEITEVISGSSAAK